MLGFDALGKLALGQLPSIPAAAEPTGIFSSWPDAAKKGGLTAAVIATSFAGFVAPPQAQATAIFSQFDQPAIDRGFIAEQPSFAILPQQLPPFTGFASFDQPLRARNIVTGFQDWCIAGITAPDTHDGVFVKKKRKGKKYDPAADELDIRAKRRGAIYDALVPKVEYSLPDLILPPRAVPPPNVEELAQMVMAARQQAEMEARQREIEADDDDLEMILKEIL